MTADDRTTSTPPEYRDIPGAPGYRVSNDGRVQSCMVKTGRYGWPLTDQWHDMRICLDKTGYCRVGLRIAGRGVGRTVHRLVLEAFVGPCPPGMECRHLDGDHSNNHISNLQWATHKENMEDTVRHGVSHKGEKSGTAKLTADDVREIVARAGAGVSHKAIASAFGITAWNVGSILYGKSWTHVTGFPKRERSKYKQLITEES